MAASQPRSEQSKNHRVCPIHTRNIGHIGPLSSYIPSHWIESLPKIRFHMPCMVQRATVPGKWLFPKQVRYIPRPTGSVLSTQEILDPSVHFLVLYHRLELSPYSKTGLICHTWFKELLYQEKAASQSRTVSDLPLGKDSIQGDGIVLDNGPMGPIFFVWIGQILWVLECTVRDSDAAIFLVQ